jgi:uncharacterized protein
MTTKQDALNWFEIYVTDFDRTKRFYEAILQTPLTDVPCEGGNRMGIFPHNEKGGVGGSITHRPELIAGPGGTLVYLNVEGDLDGVIGRVAKAGGAVLKSRTSIGEHGFTGIIKDVEGNVVGLHSLK